MKAITILRGVLVGLAFVAISACSSPTDPGSSNLINGTWDGLQFPDDFRLTLTDRGGSISGSGTYTASTATSVQVRGSASDGSGGELNFSLTVSGSGVPTTTIDGQTVHTTINGTLSEHLDATVTNSRIGTKAFTFLRQ